MTNAKEREPHHPDYAALHRFLRGYFHQDLADEYGTPEAAVAEYRSDADREEFHQVATQWRALIASSADLDAINRSLQQLGSAWQFSTLEDVASVTESFADNKMPGTKKTR
ncbi:MAG: hypothetical protein H0X25_05430 [Acidobacteriales bacterium]|nr:hypothetical protein [Terriglobales bacterium]